MELTPEQIEKIKKYIELYDATMLDDPNLDFAIEDSANSLSPNCFGTQYEKAVALLTLHMLTVAKATSEGGSGSGSEGIGAIIQKTIGPITIKWANPTEQSSSTYFEEYKTTRFGRMLLDLIKVFTRGYSMNVTGSWGV